jgi:hypothetical protein
MSARPGPRGGYRVSGIPTAIYENKQLISWSVHISCARWVVKICAYNEDVIFEGKCSAEKVAPTSVSLVLYVEVVFQPSVGFA